MPAPLADPIGPSVHTLQGGLHLAKYVTQALDHHEQVDTLSGGLAGVGEALFGEGVVDAVVTLSTEFAELAEQLIVLADKASAQPCQCLCCLDGGSLGR